jgi:CHAT domain-containing protein
MMKNISFWLFLTTVSFVFNFGIGQTLAREARIHPGTENINLSVLALMEGEAEAENFYQQGNFQQAIERLQILENDYAAQGDYLGQSRVLRNLALVHFQLGQLANAETSIENSLEILCDNINCDRPEKNNITEITVLAQVLEVKGRLEYNAGNYENAQETWHQAVNLYQGIGDISSTIRTKLYQTQALKALGLYRTARETLTSLIDTEIDYEAEINIENDATSEEIDEGINEARDEENNQELDEENQETLTEAKKILKQVDQLFAGQPDNLLKAQVLHSLGEGFRVLRDIELSNYLLQESRKIAENNGNSDTLAGTLIGLGNNAELTQDYEAALDYYQQAAIVSESPIVTVESDLNRLRVLIDQKIDKYPAELVAKIWQELAELPISHRRSYAQINLAARLIELKELQNNSQATEWEKLSDIGQLLADAVNDSRSLGDRRGEAYALGYLGYLYEQNQQWQEARSTTQEALLIAQAIDADDIAYQWQWQLGRILRAQGEREQAISSYQAAVKNLQSLRSDLGAITSEAQFSFSESVEPVYREMVGLLLPENQEATQSELAIAREAIEALQLAELDNFFNDACLDTVPVQIDQVDRTAAVFYPIILADRLEVIVAMPGQPLRRHSNPITKEKVETTLIEMRNALTAPWRRRTVRYFLPFSQEVYDWLIRPFEGDLAANDIETLVFVLDGALRNIPIAALYDGEQYLTEKYNIGLTPGLQLLPPKPIAQEELQALTAGLTEARQGFAALPGVAVEFEQIAQQITTKTLLNESFTETDFEREFQKLKYPVVHLATHGEFSSKAEDTFILTWDDRINAKDLENLLRFEESKGATIELLILSACQTAVGDKRAALGLAGVAVRAGARSTLASLWYVSDEATSLLMSQFYQELVSDDETLQRRHTKAEALSNAQRVMIKSEQFSHPYYWAAFTLVGNWL